MRIGHCQFESAPGDFDGNLAKVVKGLERADRERVEIVTFPECFLTGYEDTEEAVRKTAFAADSQQMMIRIVETEFEPSDACRRRPNCCGVTHPFIPGYCTSPRDKCIWDENKLNGHRKKLATRRQPVRMRVIPKHNADYV